MGDKSKILGVKGRALPADVRKKVKNALKKSSKSPEKKPKQLSPLDQKKVGLLKISADISVYKKQKASMTKSQKIAFNKLIRKRKEELNKVPKAKKPLKKAKKKVRSLAEKTKRPSPRERKFIENITDVEKFLNQSFTKAETILSKFEVRLKKGLEVGYNSAETRIKDGVVVLNRRGNSKVKTSMNRFTKELSKKLSNLLVSEKTIKKLFGTTGRMAIKTLNDNKKLLAEEFVIDRGAFRAFINGYTSNIEAFVFNDTRRVLENIEANFGAEVGQKMALDQVGTIKFNRNIYKLSLVSHPRAAFKDAVFDNSQREGFTFWKKVIPKGTLGRLAPSGETALSLYLILTAAQWNQKADDKQTSQVNNLGAHHGDFSYFYPILSEELEEEEEIAEAQRKKLKTQLQ